VNRREPAAVQRQQEQMNQPLIRSRESTSTSPAASAQLPDQQAIMPSTNIKPPLGPKELLRRRRTSKINPGPPTTPVDANKINNCRGVVQMFKSPFSILYVAFPLGILSGTCDWGATPTFWLNFVALIPIAKLLGDATEELDASLNNEVLSGLINASFGNAVEMIMTINALKAGLLEVVKTSLIGSVLSNMLLVLGMSFFAGGILGKNTKGKLELCKEKVVIFMAEGPMNNVTMLLLSCLSFTLPTVFSSVSSLAASDEHLLRVSRVGSCIIGVCYLAFLFFQLFTHANWLSGAEGAEEEEDEGEHPPMISMWLAIVVLVSAAIATAISSEFLVDSVEAVVKGGVLNQTFIGIILLPIVGNACEHAAAVRFAIQDRAGLAISIAVGSSTQIALFVVPFSVIVAWVLDVHMNLDFGALHTSVMVLSVLILMSVVSTGHTNWLEGWMLMSAYAFIAVMYWYDEAGDLNPGNATNMTNMMSDL